MQLLRRERWRPSLLWQPGPLLSQGTTEYNCVHFLFHGPETEGFWQLTVLPVHMSFWLLIGDWGGKKIPKNQSQGRYPFSPPFLWLTQALLAKNPSPRIGSAPLGSATHCPLSFSVETDVESPYTCFVIHKLLQGICGRGLCQPQWRVNLPSQLLLQFQGLLITAHIHLA